MAIALALTLWAVLRRPAASVRAQVSPDSHVGFTAQSGWASLGRWARTVNWGTQPMASSARRRAREIVELLLSRSPLPASVPKLERVVAAAQIQ